MVTVYYGKALGQYGFGQGHPFGPDRIDAFWNETLKQGLDHRIELGEPSSCSEQELRQFHDEAYVELVKQKSKTGDGYLDYGDTPAYPGIFEAASTVVGTVLAGLERIMNGDSKRVFVPIAGLHHARRNSAGGFCVFNDIGVAIETLRQRYGIRRVAYVDIDAHHGDGVFYSFEDDPDVRIADIHQDGRFIYPGTGFAHETGTGDAAGTKLNIPMMPGSDDQAFHQVWPQVETFIGDSKPEFILLQAGADSIEGDPITNMRYTPAAYHHATESLCRIADEYCDGRIIGTGGGGYNRSNLGLAWNEVVKAMLP